MDMKRSNMGMILGVIGGMLEGGYDDRESNSSEASPLTPLTPEQKARRKYYAYDSQMINRGLERYFFVDKETLNKVFVYAINKKNALRKFNKGNFIVVGKELDYFKNK